MSHLAVDVSVLPSCTFIAAGPHGSIPLRGGEQWT